jgi:hypothetical protein
VFTPCDQTAHFSTPSGTPAPEVGAPSPQATGCPAWVAAEAEVIQGTGNGVEHSIINNADDGWFTSTFTVVASKVDNSGPLVAPDSAVPSFTGQLTQ